MIRLTRLDGEPICIWVCPDAVCAIEPVTDGPGEARSLIRIYGYMERYVTETPEQVLLKLAPLDLGPA